MRIPSTVVSFLLSIVLLSDLSFSDSSILPEELATQSVRLKEEQLRREEEKVCQLPASRVRYVDCLVAS